MRFLRYFISSLALTLLAYFAGWGIINVLQAYNHQPIMIPSFSAIKLLGTIALVMSFFRSLAFLAEDEL